MSEIVSSRRGMGSHAVRWYILVLPVGHRGDPARALRMEASRSVKRDEAMLEYFAPKYIEVKRKGGEFVRMNDPCFTIMYSFVLRKPRFTEDSEVPCMPIVFCRACIAVAKVIIPIFRMLK